MKKKIYGNSLKPNPNPGSGFGLKWTGSRFFCYGFFCNIFFLLKLSFFHPFKNYGKVIYYIFSLDKTYICCRMHRPLFIRCKIIDHWYCGSYLQHLKPYQRNMVPCEKSLVQCTLLYTRTMDKFLFTRYQKNTAMYN